MKGVFLCLVLAASLQLQAQLVHYPQNVPHSGVTAYSSRQPDVFSFAGNQAALAATNSTSLGLFAERKFMFGENSVYTLAASLPTSLGNFGIQLNYAGFKNYNENRIGLAYARNLGTKLDVGIQFNYAGYRIPSYQNVSAISFEAGLIFHPVEKLSVGVQLCNPVRAAVDKGMAENMWSVYSLGIGYDAAENFFAGIVLVKEEYHPLNAATLLQYNLGKIFFLKAGYTSGNSLISGGAGVCWKKIRLDIVVNHHQQLGLYPGIILMADLKKIRK